MRRSLHHLMLIGICSLCLSLVGIGTAAYWNFSRYSDRARWVEHTYKVIEVCENLLSNLKDAETGQRGYLLTLNSAYLEPFYQSQPSIRSSLGQLKQLNKDNPAQQSSMKQLEILISKRLQKLHQTIELAQRKQSQAALEIVRQGQGKVWMDQIRQSIATIEQRERLLLNQRITLKQLAATQITLMLGFAALAIILLMALLALLYRSITAHQRAQAQTLEETIRSRKTLANVLESIGDGFFSLDEHWNFVYLNHKAGETFGRSPSKFIGKNIWQEFPEAIGQSFYQAFQQAIQEQQPIQIEEYYAPWEKWFECRIYPSARGLAIFFQDTTERRQTASAIEESERKFRAVFNYTVTTQAAG